MKTKNKTQLVELPVASLVKAGWNYKSEGTEEQIAKLAASIQHDGSAGVLAVREISDDVFEVIDGNHRLDAVLFNGWETVPCENFGDITLAQAVTIARRRNYQWFEDDAISLATLLKDTVLPEFSLEELEVFMPDTQAEISAMIALLEPHVWEEKAKAQQDGEESAEQVVTFQVAMPQSAYDVFMKTKKAIVERLAEEGMSLSEQIPVANGQAIEALCAEYAASYGMEGDEDA